MGVCEALRKAHVFADLDDDSLDALRAHTSVVELKRGEVLFRECDPAGHLYVVVRGKVKLGKATRDGRERLLRILGPGDMIGEVALVDLGPRIASVTAVTEACLLSIDYDNLRAWLAERPQVGDALTRQAAGWLRVGAEVMSDQVLLDVPGRLAKALLQLSERFGTAAADGSIHLTHDLTQDDLAQLVGASRETVNKTLAEFVNRGWIQLRGRAVLILDVSRLRNRAAVQVVRDPTDFEDLQTWPTEPRILIQ